jgi:acetate kinase
MSRGILTINAGSSSIKFALFPLDHPISPIAEVSGQIDGIGAEATKMVAKNRAGERIADQTLSGERVSHAQAFDALLKWFTSTHADWEIAAVGHRVVHGGDRYSQPTVIDAQVLTHLTSFTPLAPLHQPHNVAGIVALQTLLPNVPQVACFDTAFHRSQPEVAQMFGLPRAITAEGVKRYGFHGLSYEFIARALPQHSSRADGRVVVAHLGNGASMAAMVNRKCVATTLGFSTIDGLVMGTRCGNLDPGVILHLMETKNLSVKDMTKMLYKESGLLGVSGISQDMRTLLPATSRKLRKLSTSSATALPANWVRWPQRRVVSMPLCSPAALASTRQRFAAGFACSPNGWASSSTRKPMPATICTLAPATAASMYWSFRPMKNG